MRSREEIKEELERTEQWATKAEERYNKTHNNFDRIRVHRALSEVRVLKWVLGADEDEKED